MNGRKPAKLRAIDSGTMYDVAGKLLRMGREVRSGELGQITDALLVLRDRAGKISAYHFGTSPLAEAHRMACAAENRLANPGEGEK